MKYSNFSLFFLATILSTSLLSCNKENTVVSTESSPVNSEIDYSSDSLETLVTEVPKGKSQKIGNVSIKVKDFKSFGKNMKSFDENKSAIYEWISIFVEIQNLDQRPVRAVDLYQLISLTDQSGANYSEDGSLSIACKDVDISRQP